METSLFQHILNHQKFDFIRVVHMHKNFVWSNDINDGV